jgi:eukaryotic-like serine/threonine-protein kinase
MRPPCGCVSRRQLGGLHANLESMNHDVTCVVDPASSKGQTAASVDVEGEPLARGTLVDRYVVVDQVGAGGMGEVYAAYDPELDRRVALKILSPRIEFEVEEAKARLLREAQAMAQLSHPNVVAIHDAGTFGERVFLAMEFVDGKTLRSWLKEHRPSWRRIVEVFVRAGQGLAAAHRAGFVHRDFKPANVMIREDGAVRVLDFGLARPVGTTLLRRTDVPEDVSASTSGRRQILDESLTRTGIVTGTPAYMAPEQFAGETIDARSDQFSFCVALHEALYGERPFGEADYATLAMRVRSGDLQQPPARSGVPGRLRRVLIRGLSVEAAQRFASMEALLDELQRVVSPLSRRPAVWGAGLGGAAILLGAAGLHSVSDVCTDGKAKLEGAWDDERKASIGSAFAATGLSYAHDAWSRVERTIDERMAQWRAAHLDACQATHVRREQSDTLFDRRMSCLDARRSEVQALSDLLLHADAGVVEKSVQMAHGLTDVARCSDSDVLMAAMPLPDDGDQVEAIETLRADLARIEVLTAAGKVAEALPLSEAATVAARELGYEPVLVEALHQQGAVMSAAGDAAVGAELLEDALLLAEATGYLELELRARVSLAATVGFRLAQHAEGHRHVRFARALARRFPPRDKLIGAIEMAEGIISYGEGKLDESLSTMREGLAIREEALGTDHPEVAALLVNIGANLVGLNDVDGARDVLTRAVSVNEAALGPEHPITGTATHNLALVHLKSRDYASAAELLERTRVIWEAALPAGHADLARLHHNTGVVQLALGDSEAALRSYERALGIKEQLHPEGHPSLATTIGNFGTAMSELGRHEEGLEAIERAIVMTESTIGRAHPMMAQLLSGRGYALMGMGRHGEAVDALEQALVLFTEQPTDPADHAEAEFRLAKALSRQGGDARARALAREAMQRYEALGPAFASEHAAISGWLEAKPG